MEVEPIVEARLGQVDEIGGGDGHPWDGWVVLSACRNHVIKPLLELKAFSVLWYAHGIGMKCPAFWI